MCILFLKTTDNTQPNEYKLVLVNIRDEYYARPTQPLAFWHQNRNTRIIGGKDLEKGREGGTWLAMNTSGKIANLLNILQPKDEICFNKKSRGFLVVDYLEGNDSPQTYLDQISKESSDYNPFRMVAIHVKPKAIETFVFSNSIQKATQLNSGVYIFGNNKIDEKFWPKHRIGRQKFEEIVNKYNKTSKSELIEAIFGLLSDTTKYPLDDQMRSQGRGKAIESLEKMNAIHVVIPEARYGSRTWSIILVDSELNVEYIERTMKEPIDVTKDIEWITNSYTFQINDS